MPVLKICSNQDIAPSTNDDLLAKASSLVAQQLGKPEAYVMVIIQPTMPMLFGGTGEPACYMELKSIGLHETQTEGLSTALCELASTELGVDASRTYIEFADAPRKMFGWNAGTF